MRAAALGLAVALAGCSSAGGANAIDRTSFDRSACEPAGGPLLDALTPASPVDYLEWRSAWGGGAARGTRCAGATDASACEMALANVPAPSDAWAATPSGGIPAPLTYLVYTRGDQVDAVGRAGLPAFLGPLDPADAAFLAQAATEGTVACGETRLRAVTGGWEVIVTRNYTCGGGQDELLVMVGDDGTTTVLDTVTVSEGEDIICP